MVEGPSHKCPRDESSKHATKLQDDVVPAEKLDYTKDLKVVNVHGRDTMYVLCTSNCDAADEMINKMTLKIGGMRGRIIGVDLEYSREDTEREGNSSTVMSGGTSDGMPHHRDN
ncbi:hypothetical protein ZWY2020_026620 [Hordeum vulgare]|nr:hypothetical protein ZWY2020_026620 [Hordeum vulgare]